MTSYYDNNLLEEMRDLKRRVLALEKALGPVPGRTRVADLEGATGATPEGDLPEGASIWPLYLVERRSGRLYRLECEAVDDVRPLLFLEPTGRTR